MVMKITIFNGKLPARTTGASTGTVGESFETKLGALRTALGRTERFVSICACAVHDKAFRVVYERTDASRPFVITGIYKEDQRETGSRDGAPSGRNKSLPVSEIDATGWRCPYCSSVGFIIGCPGCGATVCGGRIRSYPGRSDIFECRTSCGTRARMERATAVNGVEDIVKSAGAKPKARPPAKGAFPRLGPPPGTRRLK
jgi:hypothetical protein